MIQLLHYTNLRRSFGFALLCAFGLTLLFPLVASAHAILLRSNPAKDAVLRIAPTQVQMWFSEDLNPALSTAQVVNASRQRVDMRDAHINPADSKEMDLTLQDNLPPAVYIVVWRTDSADDGHVLLGSFLFTIANPDGTIPKLAVGANPGQGILGNTNANDAGTLDGPALFNLLAVVLVELGAIFWVGAQIWVNFVLQNAAEKHTEEQGLHTQVEQRFARRFSLPTLGLLLLANLGVLYGQVLTLTGGNWAAAFSFPLLNAQATSGRFGMYWLARMVVLLLAGLVSLYIVFSKKRPAALNSILPLLNLFLGAMLFVAMTMSGHAAAVSAVLLPYSVVIDWLHLLAAALWVGGMLYILLVYLPVLKPYALPERVRSLLVVLPQYSPLAIAGIVIMAITGPLSATFHLTSVDQSITTAYGRALLVKILLVGALLATSAYHVFWLRPRMKKEYLKYSYARERLEKAQASLSRGAADSTEPGEGQRVSTLLVQQVKLREGRLARGATRLTRVLRWEPWLGVAVIVCVGLMNVFAGTLTPTSAAPLPQQQPGATSPATGPFNGTAQTSDGKYSVTLHISPNRFGTNVFTVQVTDARTGKALNANEVGVTVYTTMLDMEMGTDSLDLQPDGKGGFSGSGDLAMGGNWGIGVQLRTLDNQLHKASFKIYTPF
ncbi:MAG TPA: copper resistance protein CopC [Ktedonobacteraceae bacterium]|nr:copper resistance protein CopC [Ktedonobacteraceae bacterium]